MPAPKIVTSFDQGTGGNPPAYPAGTNGLGTCVGLAIRGGNNNVPVWYMAHIDSATQVKTPKCTCATQVTAAVAGFLNTINLGLFNAEKCWAVTSTSDFSTQAIIKAITTWAAGIPIPCVVKTATGFYVPAEDGMFYPSKDNWPNNFPGPANWSVPQFPNCT